MASQWKALILAVATLIIASPAAAQQPVAVFTVVLPPKTSATQNAMMDRLRKEHSATAITVVRLNPNALIGASVNSPRTLALSSDVTLQSVTRESRPLGGGRTLWRGEITGTAGLPAGDATLVVQGATATGTVSAPDGRQFQLRPLSGGTTAVIELDYAKLPKEEPPGNPNLEAPQGPSANAAATATGAQDAIPTIDLLVGYTPQAASGSGGVDALIELAIAETNQGFANSGVNAKVRLAGKMPVGLTEGNQDFEHILAGFVTDPTVTQKRNAVHADVSVLLINKTDYCGLADAIRATDATAFVIVHYACATGYYSFGHEIGHLVGARHDTDSDPTTTPSAYGHAFIHHAPGGAGWRTIMGYNCADGSCPKRILYWSNPKITLGGTSTGDPGSADNARVWNERAAEVAAFR